MIRAEDLIGMFQKALDEGWGYIWGKYGQVWTQKQQNAATDEKIREYGQQWVGKRVADCSGLFYWAFKELGGYMYHGSNTMYKRYCMPRGTLKNGRRGDGKEPLPGTAVFTGSEGDHGHVGLYIGGGYVIEAAGTRQGVIRSRVDNRKWTYWGELKGVDYAESGSGPGAGVGSGSGDGAEPGPGSEPDQDQDQGSDQDSGNDRPVLRKGNRGDAVKLMQQMLISKGYDLGVYGADGIFGSGTEKAVKQFQRDWGLEIDGICGKQTWGMLESSTTTKLFTVTISHLTEARAKKLLEEYPESEMREE